ncbi:MAG TPA: ROK family transcriptional regulator [Verrucomicrobiae bacterium]|jgi:predicted NBD/HSP70 family sugar kinase|nr:ROK family transcriptional regulator [Verrucomicrobiae bacterium]
MSAKPDESRSPVRSTSRRFKIKQESIANIEGDLLRKVRAQEGLSRTELARSLNLAPSTVGIYVDHLIEEGFLSEGKRVGREFGRPPTALGLNAQGGRFIGVDFEARNIMATAVDFSQKPLRQFHDTIAAEDSVRRILEKIENAICEVIGESGHRVLAIGVGVPGSIDPRDGVAHHYKHIRDWHNIPLGEPLSARFRVPVFLENNIRSMALAELWFGQGRGLQDFICLGMRSGIGAGIIIDGHIYHGSNNLAGEVGDWPCCPVDGQPGFATLEEIASVRGIQASLAEDASFAGGEFSISQLDKAAQDGNKNVEALLDRLARTLGLVISQLNCAFNPGKIILAGVFPAFGNPFLEKLRERFRAASRSENLPPLVISDLGEFNGAIGAAALAVHQWKPASQGP